MTRHRTLATLMLGTAIVLGGGLTVGAVNTSPAVGIVRLATFSNQVWPGDFNGDGITDLAGTAPIADGAAAAKVRVALGKGNGTFNPAVDTAFFGHVLAVADMNGDGKRDLIALGDPGPAPPLVILPGKGDGTFGAPVEVNVFDNLPFAAGVDMDGDGKRDLVLVNQDADRVLIFPGNGDFTFGTAVQLVTGSVPTGAIVADFNGDGRKDIAVGSEPGRRVSVFLNRGSFLFTAGDVVLDRAISDVAAGDVDGDGKVDLVASAYEGHETAAGFESTSGFVYVLGGNGDGTFRTPAIYSAAPGAFTVVVGDFTRDGVLDVATGNRSAIVYDDCTSSRKTWDSVSILPGNGNGTFGAASSFSVGNQRDVTGTTFRNDLTSLNTSDLNGDHQTDLIVSGGVLFFSQAADPTWPPTVTATATQPSAGDHSIVLRAVADDVDQDMLTYAWADSGGSSIPPIPSYCFTPATLGVHTFTATVNDGHGHSATSSVTVDFGSGGGTTPGRVTVDAPVEREVVQSGTPYTVRWTASGDLSSVTHWSLSFTTDGSRFAPVAGCTNLAASARSCTWTDPNPPTPDAQILITNRSEANEIGAQSGVFAIAGPAGGIIGDGWAHVDVGGVGAAGSATYDGFANDGAMFTVSASGADIWGTADEFHYVWKKVNGDFQINARVDSLQNVNAWTKAGLMLRADAADPSSPQAGIIVSPGKGIAFQRRTSRGGVSVSTQGPVVAAPIWLRMVRSGNTVRTYYRKAPIDLWTLAGEQTFTSMPALANIGVAVTSHADGTLATARFSGVRFSALPLLFGHAIGSATGSAKTDGTTYTVKGSGADIWGAADNFFYVATVLNAAESVTARVRSLANTDPWAKAGVMIRETLDANAKHADAIVSPSKGLALQYRAAAGGASASAAQFTGGAPIWLRLRRFEPASASATGDLLAWWSTDGVNWHPFCCHAPVSTVHSAYVGLAVTSHHLGVETTAVIDDVWIER